MHVHTPVAWFRSMFGRGLSTRAVVAAAWTGVALTGCSAGGVFGDESVTVEGAGVDAGGLDSGGLDSGGLDSTGGAADESTPGPDPATPDRANLGPAVGDGDPPASDTSPADSGVSDATGLGTDADARPPDAPPPPDAAPMPELPECECFVRASWCGAGAAEAGLGRDTPCRVPLVPAHADDLLGCEDGAWVVLESCEFGCFAAPAGTPDSCNFDPDGPTPENPGWAPCPRRDLLEWGLHPEASDRLRCAGVGAERISQTIGDAAASAGYHAEDGRTDGEPYCAAVDLRTRDLSNAEIRALLVRLGENGFAAWYRWPGHDGWPGDEAPHIHAVFAGVRMKAALEEQLGDFFHGLNGLASHSHYDFWEAPENILELIRLLYARFH